MRIGWLTLGFALLACVPGPLSFSDGSGGGLGAGAGATGGAGSGGCPGVEQCEGGSNSLQVIATSPLADGVADPDGVIAIELSIAPEPDSVAAALTVTAGSTPIPGSVSAQDRTITFTPEQRLTAGGLYSARLADSVRGAAGEALTSEHLWSFRADQDFGPAKPLDSLPADANVPHAAFLPEGDLLMLCSSNSRIWAGKLTPAAAWAGVQDLGDGVLPDVAADDAGNAISAWRWGPFDAWRARYDGVSGWEASTLLENDLGLASDPYVAVTPGGDAMAVWHQREGDSGPRHIWSRRYSSGSGWSALEQVDASTVSTGFPNDIRIRPVASFAGGFALAWSQSQVDNGRRYIWFRRYEDGWQRPVIVDASDDEALQADNPSVGLDANGNAIVVWDRQSSSGTYAWFARSTGPGEFEPAAAVPGLGEGHTTLAVDAHGDAVVASSGYAAGLVAAYLDASSGWSSPLALGLPDLPTEFDVAIDDDGSATVLWALPDEVSTHRYLRGVGWRKSGKVLNAFATSGTARLGALATRSSWTGAVWSEHDGSRARPVGSILR